MSIESRSPGARSGLLLVATSLVVIGVLSAAPEARAAEETRAPRPETRSYVLHLEPSVGMGTPVGWGGGAVVVQPIEALALHGGMGLGSQGAQVDAGARLAVYRLRQDSVEVGGGWSMGRFAQVGPTALFPSLTDGRPTPIWYLRRAHFVGAELSFTRRLGDRFAMRGFAGASVLVNAESAVCASECTSGTKPEGLHLVPYVGVAFDMGII